MDDSDLINKLIQLGMKESDVGLLIKTARRKKESVEKTFIYGCMGTYRCVALLLFAYVFFIWDMDTESRVVFSFIFLSLNLIIYFLTPFFKGFFWSLKVLYTLRGQWDE
jgi:hypothetical protein